MRLLKLCSGLLAVLATLYAPMAHADYPDDTIHMVVPWKAGGGTDRLGRGIADAMEKAGGVQVVVDNISGAGGITGSLSVARAKPDGYTVLMNGSTDMTAAMTFQKVPVSLDDFRYIGGFFTSPTWILAHKDRNLSSLKQLIDKAKAEPGKLTVGTAGPAGAQMLMAAAIKGITNAEFRIIPFSGGADLKKALLGNQVDAGIIHAPVMLPEAKEGLLKVIGAGLPLDRLAEPSLRSVPTLKDIGIPIEIGITRGIFVPKETPDEVVRKLSAILEKAAKSDGFRRFAVAFGFEPIWLTGKQFESLIRGELVTFRDIKSRYLK